MASGDYSIQNNENERNERENMSLESRQVTRYWKKG